MKISADSGPNGKSHPTVSNLVFQAACCISKTLRNEINGLGANLRYMGYF